MKTMMEIFRAERRDLSTGGSLPTARPLRFTLLGLGALLALSGCGSGSYDNSLPSAGSIGSPRGFHIARTITHFHSPYSYDACDSNPMPNGKIDMNCLHDLKYAACNNRVDFVFLTDHPNNMSNFEMKDLLLPEAGDQLVPSQTTGDPIANRLGNCANGFIPTLFPGFESGNLIALGMTQHLVTNPAQRNKLYSGGGSALTLQLQTDADAVVVIPHTESKTLATITAAQPDAMEIYNFHANVDPKIRHDDLGLPPFQDIPGMLTYLFDPWHQLNPDYGFLNFVQLSPNYFTKWDALVGSGTPVTGVVGTDSHENVFPEKVEDGERLDAHRRVMKFFSNHLLVKDLGDYGEVKDAIRKGRGWVVFEGLGSPNNMDFYATVGDATIGVGDSGVIPAGGKATIFVQTPTLHPSSPQGTDAPEIKVSLKHVLTNGQGEVVARASGDPLQYETSETGPYRAEITITPHHLKPFLGDFDNLAGQVFTWIITNHLYLTAGVSR